MRDLATRVYPGFLAQADLAVYFDVNVMTATALRISTGAATPLPDRIDPLATAILGNDTLVYVAGATSQLRRVTLGATVDVVDLTTSHSSSPSALMTSPDGTRVAWTDPYVWTLADAATARPATLFTGEDSSRFAQGYARWTGHVGPPMAAFTDDSRFAFFLDQFSDSQNSGTLTALDAEGGGARVVAERCAQLRTAGQSRVVFTANTNPPSSTIRADLYQADLARDEPPVLVSADVAFDSFAVDHAHTRVAYRKYGSGAGIYVIGLK